MFVPEEYSDYCYLIDISDNYVILTNVSHVNADYTNPKNLSIIYQYLEPSSITFESSRTFYNTQNFTEVDVSDDYWDRADVSNFTIVIFIIVLALCFVGNCITEMITKGGIFR